MTRIPSVRCRFFPRFETLEDRTLMSTCHVTRLSDVGGGFGFRGDLRYCLTLANATPGIDRVDFPKTGTINLTKILPELTDDLVIEGPGADQVDIHRESGGYYRIFTISPGVDVRMFGITVSGGMQPSDGGSCPKCWWGGGIRNGGFLILDAVVIRDNRLVSCTKACRGGGISNDGMLHISNSTISDNDAHGDSNLSSGPSAFGGGIYNHAAARLTIVNSTIADNVASIAGGPMNFAYGGGVYNEGFLSIRHATISNNVVSAATTKGSGLMTATGFPVPVMKNTIISANIGANNVAGSFTGAPNLVDGDAMLGPLGDNGGPTFTISLLPGSPAIDAGDNTDAPAFDQRGPGFPRIVNGTIDIGAFEVQATGAPKPPRGGDSLFLGTIVLSTTPDHAADILRSGSTTQPRVAQRNLGDPANDENTLNGFDSTSPVQPLRAKYILRGDDPGCALRPWAVESNPFGVKAACALPPWAVESNPFGIEEELP